MKINIKKKYNQYLTKIMNQILKQKIIYLGQKKINNNRVKTI
jgi:hypothetical protein